MCKTVIVGGCVTLCQLIGMNVGGCIGPSVDVCLRENQAVASGWGI